MTLTLPRSVVVSLKAEAERRQVSASALAAELLAAALPEVASHEVEEDTMAKTVSDYLRGVGMACFVACFADFQAEAEGRRDREATKRAMCERGGAVKPTAAATKATNGVWLVKHGHAAEALAAILASARVDQATREGASALLSKLRGTVPGAEA